MPLTVTVNTIAECLRTDCNIVGDKKKWINSYLIDAFCLSVCRGHISDARGSFHKTRFWVLNRMYPFSNKGGVNYVKTRLILLSLLRWRHVSAAVGHPQVTKAQGRLCSVQTYK